MCTEDQSFWANSDILSKKKLKGGGYEKVGIWDRISKSSSKNRKDLLKQNEIDFLEKHWDVIQ